MFVKSLNINVQFTQTIIHRKFLFIYSKFLSFFHSSILFSVCSNFLILADLAGASARYRAAKAGAYRVHVMCTSDNSILLIVWIEN
jgi:hypothetical protein